MSLTRLPGVKSLTRLTLPSPTCLPPSLQLPHSIGTILVPIILEGGGVRRLGFFPFPSFTQHWIQPSSPASGLYLPIFRVAVTIQAMPVWAILHRRLICCTAHYSWLFKYRSSIVQVWLSDIHHPDVHHLRHSSPTLLNFSWGVMNVWDDERLRWWMSEVMNVGVMNVGQS